ncbi:MAG TPA: flagellar hook-length control protein FliK, partial [Spongiibacteraceae bacterium]|nr:flagellar hook-length control protein FliK [Spongiibacteraceae bacterium]
ATTAPSTGTEQNNAAAKKDDNTLQLAANVDAAAQEGDFVAAKQPPTVRNTKATNDPLVAVPGTDAKIDPALLNVAAAAKSTEGSSFAEILKPETVAQATTSAPTAVLDTGRTPQSTRPYAEMNTATATVALPVGSSGWSDAVVDKVMWFSANQLSNAEIKLNPPDLGPLQVRISTQHDQASVVFSSPHAAVREALDQALPRLRDMLGGQGIQLSDASVGGQGAPRQQQQQQGGDNRAANSGFFRGEDRGDTPIAVTRVVGSRLATSAVDAYA